MDTSRMLQLTELDTSELFGLFTQSDSLTNIASNFREKMGRALIRSQIKEVFRFLRPGRSERCL